MEGVDHSMKALFIYNYKGEKYLSPIDLSFCHKLFFLHQTPSCICLICLHGVGEVLDKLIKMVGVDPPMN